MTFTYDIHFSNLGWNKLFVYADTCIPHNGNNFYYDRKQ